MARNEMSAFYLDSHISFAVRLHIFPEVYIIQVAWQWDVQWIFVVFELLLLNLSVVNPTLAKPALRRISQNKMQSEMIQQQTFTIYEILRK